MASRQRNTSESTSIEGIIIRAYPSREADLVLKLVSPQGKISLLAKQARRGKKKFGTSFDLLDKGSFEVIEGRGALPLVEGFTPNHGLRKIREDLNKICLASLLCETCDLLLHDGIEDSPEPYEILLLGLEAIDQSESTLEILKVTFIALGQLLAIAGYGSETANEPPSARRLVKLLDLIEHATERRLESRNSIIDLLKGLRATNNLL